MASDIDIATPKARTRLPAKGHGFAAALKRLLLKLRPRRKRRVELPSISGMVGIGLAGSFAAAVVAMLAIPGLIAGYGLLKFRPWARILTIVLSVFELIHFPYGTALGVYGLWVLLSSEGAAQFRAVPAEY